MPATARRKLARDDDPPPAAAVVTLVDDVRRVRVRGTEVSECPDVAPDLHRHLEPDRQVTAKIKGAISSGDSPVT